MPSVSNTDFATNLSRLIPGTADSAISRICCSSWSVIIELSTSRAARIRSTKSSTALFTACSILGAFSKSFCRIAEPASSASSIAFINTASLTVSACDTAPTSKTLPLELFFNRSIGETPGTAIFAASRRSFINWRMTAAIAGAPASSAPTSVMSCSSSSMLPASAEVIPSSACNKPP